MVGRFWVSVLAALAVFAVRDSKAAGDMVCVQSSTFDGEECTVTGTSGGGSDIDTVYVNTGSQSDKPAGGGGGGSSGTSGSVQSAQQQPGTSNPCDRCAQDRRQAFEISRHTRELCVDTAIDDAMYACSKAGAHPVLGAIDGRGRPVRPIHGGMLCCEKSAEAEVALQQAAEINPSVEGCGLVPVGYQGRVCLVGSFEKWWADKTGHNACPYQWSLNCQAGYLIDPDNCIESYTAGAPNTTNTSESSAGVEVSGSVPAKFSAGGSQSNSTSWSETGGSLAACREREGTRNREAETIYAQCRSSHNCSNERNQAQPGM